MFMGMSVGQSLGGVMNSPVQAPPEARLASLKGLFDQSLISQE